MNNSSSSISAAVAPCLRAMSTCASNGVPGPLWLPFTTSTAIVMKVLIFWLMSGWPQTSPATRVHRSPNFGWMPDRASCRPLSSGAAFLYAVAASLGTPRRLVKRPSIRHAGLRFLLQLAELQLLAVGAFAVEETEAVEVAEPLVGPTRDRILRVGPELVR